MKILFFGIALFVFLGLSYVMAIGALHQ